MGAYQQKQNQENEDRGRGSGALAEKLIMKQPPSGSPNQG
jgi:hypothetical protein